MKLNIHVAKEIIKIGFMDSTDKIIVAGEKTTEKICLTPTDVVAKLVEVETEGAKSELLKVTLKENADECIESITLEVEASEDVEIDEEGESVQRFIL